MIFISVGTQKFEFNRLFEKIDELIESGIIQEEVFAQRGNSSYIPKNYTYADFLEDDVFEEKVKTCDLMITHSGIATIISGLKNHKPIIVVPRLAEYKEHVDNHQLQIAKDFSMKRYVIMCEHMDDMAIKIKESYTYEFERYVSEENQIIQTIRSFIQMGV